MEQPDLPDISTPKKPGRARSTPLDCTTTGVEMVEKQSRLPNAAHRQYLHIKVEYAMRFPRLSAKIRRSGKTYQMNLKQQMMSGLIRIDEYAANFYWWYKAEVSFDMRTIPPRPYLSRSQLKTDGMARRHSLNPFPEPGKNLYRRPDIIIVKDKNNRWPGLAGTDTEGHMHGDNIARLVEVKFPGDDLSEEQYDEYMRIVGRDRKRMTILEIRDCRSEKKQWADQKVNEVLQAWKNSGAKYWPLFLYPPIFLPRPVPVGVGAPAPVKIQPWTYAEQAVADLSEGVIHGVAEGWNALSQEMQLRLQPVSNWLNDSGEWVYSQSSQIWRWVSKTGRSAASWTDAQLRAAWQEIQRTTDMTLEMLRQVNWVQVLSDVATAVGVILVAVGIGALIVIFGVPEAIIAAFLVIIRLAISAWEALALILGAGTAATLATAQ